MPQIEVTFDIDANGIVHVSAKDMATGKEQSIKIEVSSGLSEAEVKKMVDDAEKHAEEDKKKAEVIQARNEADQFLYASEKMLKDYGDKVAEGDKKNIEAAAQELKSAIAGDSLERIKAAREKLEQASHKLAEEMYKQAQQTAGPGAQPGGGATSAGPTPEQPSAASGKDGAVDADFEVVDEDKK